MFEKKEEKKKDGEAKKVKALKDFSFSFNGKDYHLKKGEAVEVPKMFLENLKTEKVI